MPPIKDSLFQHVFGEQPKNNFFGDLCDFEKIESAIDRIRPTTIYHLAAQPLVTLAHADPFNTFNTNVIGTMNLIKALTKSQIPTKVILVTTDKVYKNSDSGHKFTEFSELGAFEPYAASKVMVENFAYGMGAILTERFQIEITVVRAGNVIGGGDVSENRIIPDLVRGYQKNQPVKIRNPNSTRPWQHVLDPLFGYFLAATSSKTSFAYNFGPIGESLRVLDVVNHVRNSWPNLITELDQGDGNIKESQQLNLDSTLALRHLGWSPKYDQYLSVQKTVDWWDAVIGGVLSPKEACMKDILEYKSLINL